MTLPTTDRVSFGPSAIHGTGGVAKQFIPAAGHVLEYLGEKIAVAQCLERCEQNNPYIFGLDSATYLDGNVDWNPARLINHSCLPNCDAVLENGRVWLVANRDIFAGEEITFNYGFDLVDYREHPCHCGSPNCVGYIVDEAFFDHVRRNNSQRDGVKVPTES